MTPDREDNPLVTAAIEAMARAMYDYSFGIAAFARDRDRVICSASIKSKFEQAEAAFHAQHGIVRVVPIEATIEMDATLEGVDGEEDVSLRLSKAIYAAMTAAGDLTKPKDGDAS